MQATKWQKYKIITLSLLKTLSDSIRVIFTALVFKGLKARQHIDGFNQRWSRSILNIAGIKYSITGNTNMRFQPQRSYVIMSNHASLYDIPLIVQAFPHASVRMIAKKELFRVPIWGRALKMSEFVSIDRQNRHQAQKDIKEARRRMESGIVLWVAPEGTRTRTGKIGKFKKGGFLLALQTKAIIVPVGIIGSGKILPPDTTDFNLGEEVNVRIGDTIDTKDYGVRQMRDLMQRVEGEIRKLVANEVGN